MSSPQPDPATGPAEAIGAPPPLRRSSADRVFAGVCGGVARRFGVSALAVRVAFTVLVLTGIGVAVYVVMAIACPADDDPRPMSVVRVVTALVAGLAALALSAALLHALGIGRYALGGSGSLLLIVFLAGLGPEDRKFATALMTVHIMFWATLVLIGSFFRGPGFNFVLPWRDGLFFDLRAGRRKRQS